MAYSKIYTRINWVNKQVSKTTPVGAIRLNQIDGAIDELDNRVIEQETLKLDKSTALTMISDWSMDEKTGIITITKLNGEKIMFDLNIEKIPVNFTLSEDGILTMASDDGTEFTANIGDMIPVLTFESSDEIAVTVTGEGKDKTYSFSIKAGSVTEDKLQPNFLADIKVQAANAQSSAEAAAGSETNAKASEQAAAGSAELAKGYAEQAKEIAGGEFLPLTGGTVSGETNINGIAIKQYYLPDNRGWTKYFLMFDITSWYTSTKGSKSGFTGQIFSQRPGGYMREEIVKIIMGVSYKKVDTEDGAQLCLRTTSTGYIPCIVYDSINEKYYLALKIGGSDRVLCFAGCFQGTYLGTFISATDSTGTMPEGYEVVNSDYKIIVEPRATADADGNNIHNTYIPKSSILNEQEEIEANTDENNVAGALALKELSKNMGGLRFGVDSDGNYGYYKDGADTVTPFKSGGEISVDAVSMLLSGSISTTTTVSFTGLKSITFKMLTSGTVTVTYDDGTTKDITVNTGSTGITSRTINVVGANKIVIKTQSSMTTSISIIDYE